MRMQVSDAPPKPRPVQGPIFVNISASIINDHINFFTSANVGGQTHNNTWEYDAEDDESFALPDDLARATLNMLIGVGQRLKYLQRYGFDREP